MLLHKGERAEYVAEVLGVDPSSIRRLSYRYAQGGIGGALENLPRRAKPKRLDAKQEARIVAMVCGPPPEGRTRWTIEEITAQAKVRGIVTEIGRETMRRLLKSHHLKPWREKNVVRPRVDVGVRGAHRASA